MEDADAPADEDVAGGAYPAAAGRLRAPRRVEGGAPVDVALDTRADRAGTGRVELLRDGRTVSVTAAR